MRIGTTPVPDPVEAPAPQPVSVLMDTLAQAENEGSEVTIEVVGAREVLNESEYAQLQTLPAQEQMLVTLASIGLQDVVESALAAMNMTFSEEAASLTAQVSERFAAMNTQLEETLTEYFPKAKVTVGGVTREYFVVDLVIHPRSPSQHARFVL